LKTWKGPDNEAKGNFLGKTSKKDMPLGHLLILRTCLHVKYLHLEPPTKKNRSRGSKAKWEAKDFDAIKGQ
jgi:hypothetical protein